MSLLSDWNSLAARIEGLTTGGELMASMLLIHANDMFGAVRKSMIPELKEINQELDTFLNKYRERLSPQAISSLSRYLEGKWVGGLGEGYVDLQSIVPIRIFKTQFEYLIRDTEVEARSLVELAFQHLRQLLIVDDEFGLKWRKAFSAHETKCEQLGSAHLLGHGVWAFKVVANGSATDLVCSEPILNQLGSITKSARTLALTEWKRVRDESHLEKFAKEAREQTEIYSAGSLGALELKRTRYIVLVTERDVSTPNDIESGNVLFRHIIIPVNPGNPSVIAKGRVSKSARWKILRLQVEPMGTEMPAKLHGCYLVTELLNPLFGALDNIKAASKVSHVTYLNFRICSSSVLAK